MRINLNYQTLILLLLWISGMIKPFFITYIANIDLVLLSLIITVLDVAIHLLVGVKLPKKSYLLGLLIILVFYGYILISNLYSSSDSYALTKSINFIPNVLFFTYALFLSSINISLFIKVYAWILIPLSFFFVYMKSILWSVDTEATRLFMDLRNYYLAIGFHLGLLFFLCLHYLKKFWLLALIFFLLIASTARGALLFTILTLVLVEYKRYINIRIRKKHISIGLVSITFLIPLLILFRNRIYSLLETSIYRFIVLFEEGGASALGRMDRMKYAFVESFSSIRTSLFGHGIGSFGIEYSGFDIRSYPHNIFLEVLFELGITGIVLILFLFTVVFYCSLKGNRLFLLLFIFAFLNAMKSSSLTDLWILCSIMGLVLNRTSVKQNYKSVENTSLNHST